jgi:hypothetical protein
MRERSIKVRESADEAKGGISPLLNQRMLLNDQVSHERTFGIPK